MKVFFIQFVTSCGGLGYLPKAPGTWGSLGALFFWAVMGQSTLGWPAYFGLLTLLFFLGVWASKSLERGDAPSIVIDEWVGMGVALCTTGFWWPELVAGFLLFRIFDIAKPLGIRRLDAWKKPGWSVMLDDVLAGVYAAIILGVLNYSGVWHEAFGSGFAH